MARKVIEVPITAEGRDQGKVFVLTELPAYQSEAWGIRALGVMMRAGLSVPDTVVLSGMATIAAFGLRSLFSGNYAEVQPLLDEMMTCVTVKEPAFPSGRPLTSDDIEEVPTRIRLRDEVIRLHTNFSPTDELLKSLAVRVAAQGDTLNTSTSEPKSEPLSPADEQPS